MMNDPHHVREDCRLIERYGVPEKKRREVIDRLLEIALGNMKHNIRPREVIAAIRALGALDRLNLEFTKLQTGQPDQSIHVEQTVVHQNVAELRKALQEDNDYLDYLRTRSANGHAGRLGGNGRSDG